MGSQQMMLRVCEEKHCTTLTLGTWCLEHEPVGEPRRFPRGRPFPREVRSDVRRIEEAWPLAEPVLLRSSSSSLS